MRIRGPAAWRQYLVMDAEFLKAEMAREGRADAQQFGASGIGGIVRRLNFGIVDDLAFVARHGNPSKTSFQAEQCRNAIGRVNSRPDPFSSRRRWSRAGPSATGPHSSGKARADRWRQC